MKKSKNSCCQWHLFLLLFWEKLIKKNLTEINKKIKCKYNIEVNEINSFEAACDNKKFCC